MDNIFATQLLEQAMANVDPALVVALMAVGFIIKHFKLFEKIENNIIPPVLLVFSIVVLTISDGFDISTVISAIVNAAVAIGLHQQGKNIFTVTVIPSIADLFNKLLKKEEEFVDEEEVIIEEDSMETEIDETIEVEI